jgi:hypothetical protein
VNAYGVSGVSVPSVRWPSARGCFQNPMASSIARYESFLINNVSTISTLESSLRTVTWFLPGRFKDAELASEARQLLSITCMHVSDNAFFD